ncbi:PfkB family carbohydrate kinase [Nocardioides dongkuii]|uniref:PfkB family carbohydrate kinase n=1 Tax=Nocardioides dongkuii TaxID=2760089 RepID=UPI0015F88070|nr:PfkB family carbohydrate kinase [Nocardioides dongkuii]
MTGVVVVGGINQDITVRVDRRPRAGETVVGDGPAVSAGGKGANMAVAAARAGGVRVALCGAVGADAAGRDQVEQLRQAGVDVAGVAVRADAATGSALIVVTPDGENSIAVGAGANATLTDAQVAAACRGARVVLAQTEVGPGPVVAAARVTADDARLVLSPAPVVELPADVLALADPLVVNEEEAADLAGVPDAARVRERTGARSVVLTLGAAGVEVADAAGTRRLPAPTVTAVDTTGAGDVLAGTLAAALAGGRSLDEALEAAVAAAARSVQHRGARA